MALGQDATVSRAELIRQREMSQPEDLVSDPLGLLHELSVHQVQLEMQNQEAPKKTSMTLSRQSYLMLASTRANMMRRRRNTHGKLSL